MLHNFLNRSESKNHLIIVIHISHKISFFIFILSYVFSPIELRANSIAALKSNLVLIGFIPSLVNKINSTLEKSKLKEKNSE